MVCNKFLLRSFCHIIFALTDLLIVILSGHISRRCLLLKKISIWTINALRIFVFILCWENKFVITWFRGPVVTSFAFTVKDVGSNLMPGGLASRKMGTSWFIMIYKSCRRIPICDHLLYSIINFHIHIFMLTLCWLWFLCWNKILKIFSSYHSYVAMVSAHKCGAEVCGFESCPQHCWLWILFHVVLHPPLEILSWNKFYCYFPHISKFLFLASMTHKYFLWFCWVLGFLSELFENLCIRWTWCGGGGCVQLLSAPNLTHLWDIIPALIIFSWWLFSLWSWPILRLWCVMR